MANVNWKELLKTISQIGLGALLGNSGFGMGAPGGYRGGSGKEPISNSGKGSWASSFLYPVITVGGKEANDNSVGRSRDADYAHGRTEEEHRAIIDKYENQYLGKVMPGIMKLDAGQKRQQALALAKSKAREYAVMMSQTLHDYLPFDYMNTPADTMTKVNPVASSSWVGNIRRLSPTEVEVNLNGKPYRYGGTPAEVERFLNCPSLGREIIAIKKGAGSSLRKLF